MAKRRKEETKDPAGAAFDAGAQVVALHPILGALWVRARVVRRAGNLCPKEGWAVVTTNGYVHVHPTRRGEPAEWTYVLAHCMLHLGLGHLGTAREERAWNAACDYVVTKFLTDVKIGRAPQEMRVELPALPSQEEELRRRFLAEGIPDEVESLSTGGKGHADMAHGEVETSYWHHVDWRKMFGEGLVRAVDDAVRAAAGQEPSKGEQTLASRVREWFVNRYPLLGSMATGFKIIEDRLVCQRMGISVAAVDAQAGHIFINTAAGLDEAEMRFVMAHELLHVGLRHQQRCQGRDAYLWNVACDYVINGWLVEMGFGVLPRFGGLYDPELKGLSAEAVYDRIVTDMRRYRKLATFRGVGVGDLLEGKTKEWWEGSTGMELDDFYRRCMTQGLSYHEEEGRGYLPVGLVQEIQALAQPPMPWDVALARWFDGHFSPVEKRRSYARSSRRQAATPEIPRPRWVAAAGADEGRTFGVVLDTSGSMSAEVLSKALGAIANYALSRDVPWVRVVFCDAAAYDAGYLAPEAIAGKVKVKGRGGTVLQPGIDLLEKAEDFPQQGPILVITDGACDRLKVRREHAFLLPQGRHLPFVPVGEVFRIK